MVVEGPQQDGYLVIAPVSTAGGEADTGIAHGMHFLNLNAT